MTSSTAVDENIWGGPGYRFAPEAFKGKVPCLICFGGDLAFFFT
jgi:hypothetical protein